MREVKYSEKVGIDFHQNEKPLDLIGQYSTFLFGNETVRIIKEHQAKSDESSQPFFIQLAFNAIHAPLEAPQAYIDTCSKHDKAGKMTEHRRLVCACLLAADEQLGLIDDALKETGLYDNTIVLFFSDNGGDLFYHSSNAPYRGNKGDSWEGGVKSYSLLYGGYITKTFSATGYTNTARISVTDWFPSFGNLVGAKMPDIHMDGMDVWNALKNNEKSPRTDVLIALDEVSLPGGRKALISGDWKFMSQPTNPGNHHLKNFLDPPQVLFNITDDPYEERNLFHQFPEVAAEMKLKLKNYGPALPDRSFIFDAEGSDPAKFGGFWEPWLNDQNSENSCQANWECPSICSVDHVPVVFYMDIGRDCNLGDNRGALFNGRSFWIPTIDCNKPRPITQVYSMGFSLLGGLLILLLFWRWFLTK